MKKPSNYPPGWDEARVCRVLAHYEEQAEEEAVAEDEEGRATEIERSGDAAKLEKAVRRLGASGAPQKTLKVPYRDIDAAATAMREAGVSGNVENLSGTKSRKVRARKK